MNKYERGSGSGLDRCRSLRVLPILPVDSPSVLRDLP